MSKVLQLNKKLPRPKDLSKEEEAILSEASLMVLRNPMLKKMPSAMRQSWIQGYANGVTKERQDKTLAQYKIDSLKESIGTDEWQQCLKNQSAQEISDQIMEFLNK